MHLAAVLQLRDPSIAPQLIAAVLFYFGDEFCNVGGTPLTDKLTSWTWRTWRIGQRDHFHLATLHVATNESSPGPDAILQSLDPGQAVVNFNQLPRVFIAENCKRACLKFGRGGAIICHVIRQAPGHPAQGLPPERKQRIGPPRPALLFCYLLFFN